MKTTKTRPNVWMRRDYLALYFKGSYLFDLDTLKPDAAREPLAHFLGRLRADVQRMAEAWHPDSPKFAPATVEQVHTMANALTAAVDRLADAETHGVGVVNEALQLGMIVERFFFACAVSDMALYEANRLDGKSLVERDADIYGKRLLELDARHRTQFPDWTPVQIARRSNDVFRRENRDLPKGKLLPRVLARYRKQYLARA
ncbi:MAG: hypothetical protein A3K19_29130 [Lentisphaerae bacterium RIFOXYB12_FULL_65_16]|nr:MAG: hypothetical protein A3K18_04520 [Lentisphaerae bacterium RIFOXYA12_64_32]OGV88362.1 MAG: hypothetical protein A3K19_29130 [Lentisphaerae bacterium RIFOXYB12_FULL_65_16]